MFFNLNYENNLESENDEFHVVERDFDAIQQYQLEPFAGITRDADGLYCNVSFMTMVMMMP